MKNIIFVDICVENYFGTFLLFLGGNLCVNE